MVKRAFIVFLSLAVAAPLAVPAIAAGKLEGEVTEGRALARSLESGRAECGDLDGGDFDAIGEYAMARYVGDGPAHEAMNLRTTRMMGEAGEARMHSALGRRYSGCGGGGSGWIEAMAGMMNGEGGALGRGMMGAHSGGGMGGMSTAAWVAIVAAAGALVVGAAVLLSRQRTRSG